MRVRVPSSLFFFQNGPKLGPRAVDGSILDGQGHVTAIHVATGRVSELHIPVPKIRVSLTDICNRRFLWCLLTTMFHLGHIHTGTANTAVLKCDGDILAVEEGSKPYRLRLDADNALVDGEWLYHRAPIGVHADGDTFTYSPFRNPSLKVNGLAVDWNPTSFPAMIHSMSTPSAKGTADACTLRVLPLISTHIGEFWRFLRGKQRLPLVERTTLKYLVLNVTTGAAIVVNVLDSGIVSNPLHILKSQVDAVRNEIEIYACHVKDFAEVVCTTHNEVLRPTFELRKEVFSLSDGSLLASAVFPEASGDFPNAINDTLFLVNSLRPETGTTRVVIFDTERDAVIHEVHLPFDARDVLFYEDHLLFCTLDSFCMYDLVQDETVYRVPIPKRDTNFHASLLWVSGT